MELNKIIKKVLRESIVIESEHTPENRILKLIQNYLDNVLVPGNNLICDTKIYYSIKDDQYLINLWVNYDDNIRMDEYDDLVDTTWDEIYNMFEIPVSVQKVRDEC
jgi:hypothetical protein